MITKSTVRNSLFLLVVALFALAMTGCDRGANQNVNANTPPPANKALNACDGKTDAGIEAALLQTLKNDPKIAPQMNQINFFSTSCVVTLQGWVDNIEDFKAVLKATLATPDVKSMNFDAFWVGTTHVRVPPPGGQCNPGYKQCGDFCIPEGDRCIIKSDALSPAK